jgi:tRNA(adenine34) deaminase
MVHTCTGNAPSVRRRFLVRVLSALSFLAASIDARSNPPSPTAVGPDKRWYEEALRMKRMAESWKDQPYGAVLVLDGQLVGEGPSRVVQLDDPTAHAERVSIRDAQRRLQRTDLRGSILYSTSRPCAACEAAAAAAGVSRMYFGEDLHDAGSPKR